MSASVCVSVCLSVPQDIPGTPSAIFTKFLCMLPMAVARCSSGTLTIGRIAYCRGGVFFRIDNAHCNAFAAKGIIRSPITSYSTRDHSFASAFAEHGIGREGGDGSVQRGQSVIYDCFDSICCLHVVHDSDRSLVGSFLLYIVCRTAVVDPESWSTLPCVCAW